MTKPAKARPARHRHTIAKDAVPCTVAGPPTGPKTEDDPARLTAARACHGQYTKEKRAAASTTDGKYSNAKRAEAKRRAVQGRQMRAKLAELEAWFVDHGHLDKKWRDWFK